MKKLILVIGLLVLLAGQVWGADFYVNGSGAEYAGNQGVYGIGNDSTGDGSLATPWATINKAGDSASDSDTIYIAAATYNEDHATFHSLYDYGKSLEYVADGPVVVESIGTTYVVYLTADKVTSFSDFIFDGEDDTTDIVYTDIGANTKTLTTCTIRDPASGGSLIHNVGASDSLAFESCILTANETLGWIIDLNGATNWAVSGGSITASGVRMFQQFLTDMIAGTLSNCDVNISLTNDFMDHAASGDLSVTGNNITISGTPKSILDMTEVGKTGDLDWSGNTITSASVFSATLFDISLGIYGVSIEGNTINLSNTSNASNIIKISDQATPVVSNNNTTTVGISGNQHIEIISTGVVGVATVDGNTSYTKSKDASRCIIVGTDVSGAGDNKLDGSTLSNNTAYGPLFFDRSLPGVGTHGLEYGYNKSGIVKNNYINGFGFGLVIKGANEDYTGSDGVSGNVIVDCADTSGGASSFLRLKGVLNVPIIGNAFILTDTSYNNQDGLIHITDGDDPAHDTAGCILKNNIFSADRSGFKFINLENDGSTITITDVDYNSHYNGANAIVNKIAATTYPSWSTWQTAGYDPNGIDLDPKLSPSGKISKLSPCVDAGSVDAEILAHIGGIDIFGNKLFWGVPDIGANEVAPRGGNRILRIGGGMGF